MITDIDKRNADRGEPTPNHHDVMPPGAMTAKGTNSLNYITTSTNQSLVSAAKNGQFTIVGSGTITTSSADTGVVAAGNFANFHLLIGSTPHNIPYIPGLSAYIDVGSFGKVSTPDIHYSKGVGTALWYEFRVAVDSTNLYVYVDGMAYGTGTSFAAGFTLRYYLLQQTSN